ncbi:extracellular solute-binding protein [Phytohabitans suffuscus]|uniref:ABC transporter substrate-binding protein n=1 Tax=Phytohabitans suffuscus TaxID=624315 RepID=A0A6F8YAZ4_9ACTN|nr:extracellular solute-binding protein [Phytohabitans suffuscus]BCB83266.1 ABC transporter substrate-binding protein [Phytohabitans suffuscus]
MLVSACGGGGSGSSDAVRLTVWTWSNEAAAAFKDGIIDAFEKAHPDIEVEVVPQLDKNYETLLTTGLAGSQSPDIVALRSYGVLSSFAASGNIVPLDDVVKDWSGFSKSALAGAKGKADGKLYAVPQGIQTAQVYYNKKVFADLGLGVPGSWDEFVAAAQKIKDSGTAPIVIPGAVAAQISLAAEILGNARRGAGDFQQAFLGGEKNLTDPDNVAAIGLMEQIKPFLVDNVTSVTLDEAVTLFATGRAAMFPSGTWQVTTFKNLGADIDYGTFDVPVNAGWPSKAVTVSYADGGWALAKRSQHPDQAGQLLNWLGGTEFGNLYANAMGTIPARDGVTLENPLLSEMYQRYQATPSVYLGAAYLRYGSPSGTDLLGQQVQKIWLGETTPADAAKSVQTGIDAWFKPADFAKD